MGNVVETMFTINQTNGAQELCESRGGRPRLPVPDKPTVSVDVKQHFNQQQQQQQQQQKTQPKKQTNQQNPQTKQSARAMHVCLDLPVTVVDIMGVYARAETKPSMHAQLRIRGMRKASHWLP